MILIVLENPYNYILSFVDKMEAKYPRSSVGYLGPRDKLSNVVAVFNKPPLFTSGWLIKCSPNVRENIIQKAEANGRNTVIIKVVSAKQRDDVFVKLKGIPFKYIDNYKPARSELITWIQEELHCSQSLAVLVLTRTHEDLRALMDAVSILSIVGNLDEATVKRFIKKERQPSIGNVVPYLLGIQSLGVTKKNVLKAIYNYKFATGWLLEFLVEQLDIYIRVFTQAIAGNLTLANYKKFKVTCDDKKITNLSDFQLKKILEAFGEVSLEYVLFLQGQLVGMNKNDKLSICKIVNLVKMGG